MVTSPALVSPQARQILASTRVFLLDLDGTLYLGERWLPGAREFLSWLQGSSHKYLILTNNSSRDPAAYRQKLGSMGAELPLECFYTSGDATLHALIARYPRSRVFVAGTTPLKKLFRQAGFQVVNRDPEVVVLGFDTRITYETLRITCDFVRTGLPYFATHPDLNCPIESGTIPDTGAFIALIAASTGRQPDEICGKPYPALVDAISQRLGCPPEQMTMVGDRLNTDIALGSAGIRTILVLTGETTLEDLQTSPWQPDIIFQNIGELHMALSSEQE